MKKCIVFFLFLLPLSFTSAAVIETVGQALVDRQTPDGTVGAIFLMANQNFTQTGRVSDWGFFNNEATGIGRQLTPLLFQNNGGNSFTVKGIGATQTNDASGAQNFSFDLQVGTDIVGAGDVFGWKEGTQSSTDNSVVETDFTIDGRTGTMLFFGTHTTISVGETLSSPSVFTRDYSIQFTTTDDLVGPVPEPSTVLLLLVALFIGKSCSIKH